MGLMIDRAAALAKLCRERAILAVYLFGSRSEEGLRALRGGPLERAGSDLDVGVVFESAVDLAQLGPLQACLEEVFRPLRVDLVPLQRVDAIFQFRAIDGHRVFASDSTAVACYELEVMRRATELLPIQRRLEREMFGVSTS